MVGLAFLKGLYLSERKGSERFITYSFCFLLNCFDISSKEPEPKSPLPSTSKRGKLLSVACLIKLASATVFPLPVVPHTKQCLQLSGTYISFLW